MRPWVEPVARISCATCGKTVKLIESLDKKKHYCGEACWRKDKNDA